MKHLLLITSLIFLFSSCNLNQNGDKATAYVKEKMHELNLQDSDIESIEAEESDSVLSDILISTMRNDLLRSISQYQEGKIKKNDLIAKKDKYEELIDAVYSSLHYGIVVNDSLKTIKEYDQDWRQCYSVNVKMKSGKSNVIKVIMDKDGSARMIEKELDEAIDEYRETGFNAENVLNNY